MLKKWANMLEKSRDIHHKFLKYVWTFFKITHVTVKHYQMNTEESEIDC